jgi:hypothetical protein
VVQFSLVVSDFQKSFVAKSYFNDRPFTSEGGQGTEHSPNSSPLAHHLLLAAVQGEVDWLCEGALTSRVLKKTKTDDSTAQRLARRSHSVSQHIFTH